MTSWLGEANHGGFSSTRLGLSDDISALENRNHKEANYYLDLLWGLELQRLFRCHNPQRVLADHACAAKVWHFFWSRFSVGFRDSEKKEGSRWWESRSSKKWVRKRGWWWLMMDFLFWIFFFFFVWSVLDFLFDQWVLGWWWLMMVVGWVDWWWWLGGWVDGCGLIWRRIFYLNKCV